MTRRIMIVDALPTRRIVMKAKLGSAQYQVVQACSLSEASAELARDPCDVVFVDSQIEPNPEAARGFCAEHKAKPSTGDFPIILMSDVLSQTDMLAAFDAGFDEIMFRPHNERVLLAQLRALLRRKAASDSPREHSLLCDMHSRNTAPHNPVHLAIVAQNQLRAKSCATMVTRSTGDSATTQARAFDFATVLHFGVDEPPIDAIVLIADDGREEAALNLLSDLRAHPSFIGAGLIVALRPGHRDYAARAFDLGADSVVRCNARPSELLWRARTLGRRKQRQDMLHRKVSDGLRMALTDPLTGLHNRRFATRRLSQLAATGDGFGLLMMDLDHFKQINDLHGHATGDAVLVHIADALRANLRNGDLLARIGGEEFLVALPGACSDEAIQTAERLRDAIGQLQINVQNSDLPLRVTMSVGLIHNDDNALSVDDLLARADAALYRSKSHGRNRVSISVAA